MTHKPADPPPSVAIQLLSLSAIFALGLAGGWVLWGRDTSEARNASESPLRKIVLGKADGPGGAAPAAMPSAPSASLDRIFRALTIVNPDARMAAYLEALAGMKPEDAPAVRQKLKDGFLPTKDRYPERMPFSAVGARSICRGRSLLPRLKRSRSRRAGC